jgi:hypothetical protein
MRIRKNPFLSLLVVVSSLSFTGCGGSPSMPSAPNPPPAVHNEWTWMSGSNTVNQSGSYGSLGAVGPTTDPGARSYAVSWTDKSGNLWLFGGIGLDSSGAGQIVDLNDLWEYSGGQWRWVSGSNIGEQLGVYGSQGVAASINSPGARYQAMGWADPSGTFWLSGGIGPDIHGKRGRLSDLWKYSSGQWTWVGGSQTTAENVPGVYGSKGTPADPNQPGGRVDASTWADTTGNLWLFGGLGYDSTGTLGLLNDLWRYSAGQWTWVSGSNMASQTSTYGTEGVAATINVPGARFNAVSWVDSSGTLFLFGGGTYEPNTPTSCEITAGFCDANDLWKFANGEWTWVSGSNSENQPGVYGTQGTPATDTVPGARFNGITWTDASGDFWLFGGDGLGKAGSGGELNDLWKYSSGHWTWVGGSNLGGQIGTYGIKGTAAATNQPGSREAAMSWVDASGNFWIFGGESQSSVANGKLNDLWRYQP